MNKDKIDYFKKKLEERKAHIEKDLTSVGQPNLKAPGDWEPIVPEMDILPADPNELADKFEEMENEAAIETNFEEDIAFINEALEKIKKGKYGICEDCGKEIEEKVLEVNPQAKYCIKHNKLR